MRAFSYKDGIGREEFDVEVVYDQTTISNSKSYLVLIFQRLDGHGSYQFTVPILHADELLENASWLSGQK